MADEVAARFAACAVGWQAKLREDEWFFAALRQELVAPLSAAEAFEGIGGVVELVLHEHDEFLCSEGAELLLALARQSSTTELPPVLQQEWGRLLSHLASFGEYVQGRGGELACWYRRKSAEPGAAADRPRDRRCSES